MNRKTGKVVFAAAVATAALSCTDPVTTRNFAEQWAAHSIDGKLVPYRHAGTIVDVLVLADTIEFGTQRRFEQHSVGGTISRATEDTTLSDRHLGGSYEISGAKIRLRYDCLQPSPGEEQCPGDRTAEILDERRLLLSNGIEYRAVVPQI